MEESKEGWQGRPTSEDDGHDPTTEQENAHTDVVIQW